MKKIKIGEFVDAMEKNGYRQEFNRLFAYLRPDGIVSGSNGDGYRPIIRACALGQGFLNLSIDDVEEHPEDEADAWNRWSFFTSRVIEMNDLDHLPIQTIVDKVRTEFADILDMELSFTERSYVIAKGAKV